VSLGAEPFAEPLELCAVTCVRLTLFSSFLLDPLSLFVYYCSTYYRVGGGVSGGHVLRETTSRGLCGLVCPSRTSERGGKGDCVKEGGGGEGERERERALGLLLCHSPRH
jgi:hypothetical protein